MRGGVSPDTQAGSPPDRRIVAHDRVWVVHDTQIDVRDTQVVTPDVRDGPHVRGDGLISGRDVPNHGGSSFTQSS